METMAIMEMMEPGSVASDRSLRRAARRAGEHCALPGAAAAHRAERAPRHFAEPVQVADFGGEVGLRRHGCGVCGASHGACGGGARRGAPALFSALQHWARPWEGAARLRRAPPAARRPSPRPSQTGGPTQAPALFPRNVAARRAAALRAAAAACDVGAAATAASAHARSAGASCLPAAAARPCVRRRCALALTRTRLVRAQAARHAAPRRAPPPLRAAPGSTSVSVGTRVRRRRHAAHAPRRGRSSCAGCARRRADAAAAASFV